MVVKQQHQPWSSSPFIPSFRFCTCCIINLLCMQVLSLPVWKQANKLSFTSSLTSKVLRTIFTIGPHYVNQRQIHFFVIAKLCIAYPKIWIFEIHGWSLFLIKCLSAKIFHILYISQQTVLWIILNMLPVFHSIIYWKTQQCQAGKYIYFLILQFVCNKHQTSV